jgi:hypothetical protein
MFENGVVLLSLAPVLLLGLTNYFFRRSRRLKRSAIGFVMLLVSFPLGIELIGKVLHVPDDIGDHNPGFGVVFAPLIVIWLLCLSAWFV